MSKPGEHKTVQTRILAYAEEVGWIPFGGIPREEAERQLGIARGQKSEGGCQKGSLFFDDLIDAHLARWNPYRYPDNVSNFSHNLNRLFQDHHETHFLS